ncbi:hypothetical protein K469DRAFT_46057 [Zopfia rhizophila CBS 207.26]|uniref:Uncharacterized protein n=1 Tax=Zopfia rhizophila CBS 207.26 TaxID=1314779 RepID=A0A6A6EFS5_9PEZI|nr:hypothetical protein K469DRAFT_46057 [Zopfia rhizophila CBS 207.26]
MTLKIGIRIGSICASQRIHWSRNGNREKVVRSLLMVLFKHCRNGQSRLRWLLLLGLLHSVRAKPRWLRNVNKGLLWTRAMD